MKPTMSIRSFVILLVLVNSAFAGTARKQEADQLITTDHTKTYSLPSATDTLVGRASTDTLTNKTISGASNTFSQLPVATQIQQYTVTAYPNGSTTAFTLSPTPAASGSVQIFLDGMIQRQGSGFDYTISGATVTFTTAPAAGQIIWADYSQY